MTDALFVPDGDGFVATELSGGPWVKEALHGGPVAAILAHELEAWPSESPLFPARLTIELLRPFGFDPFGVEVREVRPGRKVRVLEAHAYADPGAGFAPDRVIARGVLQQIRTTPLPLAATAEAANGPDPGPPPPEALPKRTLEMPDGAVRFHNAAVEHRTRTGLIADPGPAVDWIRLVVDLLPGVPPTPLVRVAAAADFGNGVSSVVTPGGHVFINPDLTILLHRLPVDEWVCLDAVTRVGDEGVGFAESALFDRDGRIGRAAQSLLFDTV